MAQNDLLVRLGLDTNNFDKSIQNTKKSITDFGSKSKNELADIADRFKRTSESTAPLGRKIKDIKKYMEELVVTGQINTKEGKQMWMTLAAEAKKYQNTVEDINKSVKNGGKDFNLKEISKEFAGKTGLGGAFDALTGAAAGPVGAIMAVGGTMIAAGKATAEFETHLNSLQALTGLTDQEMKSINDGAIEMSKNFSSSASEIVDAMKLIGSQAPELLKDSDALMKVTEAANVLSEAAEISVEDAAKAITGTMNQMGVSASEASNIINTFAAASQQGSADVAYLNRVFEKSGTAASDAGMSYVELASAIEAVAPKFSSCDEAGTKLSGVLLKLSVSGKNEFMPAVVGMSQALENLEKAGLDDAAMIKLVGEGNITMLKTLIQNREQFDAYSQSLAGTNTAYEQMATNQKGFNGMIKKLTSAWNAFLLVLGQSGIMQGITDGIIKLMGAINEVINVLGDIVKAFEDFGDEGTESIDLLQIQIDLLVTVIRGLGEIIQVVVRGIAKLFNWVCEVAHNVSDSINEKWQELKNKLKDNAFAKAIIGAFNKILDAAANMCSQIKKYWNKLKEFLGMKVEANVEENVKHADSNVEDDNSGKSTSGGKTKTGGSGKSKGKKSKGKKSTKTEKIDYLVSVDDNSLETAEKKLSAWTSKKKKLNIDDKEAIKKCDDEIKKWTEEVKKRKLLIENLGFESGSKADLENQIKKLEEDKKILFQSKTDPADIKKVEDEIKALKKKLEAEEIRLGLKPVIEAGSISDIKKQIEEKEKEISLALNTNISPESMQKLQNELDELRKKEKEKSIELGVIKNSATISPNEDNWSRGSMQDKKQSLSNANSMVAEMQENYRLKIIGKDEVESQLSDINSKLQELGLKPITLTFNSDGTLTTAAEDLERFKGQMDSVSSTVGSMGSVFSSLGGAIGGTTGEVMNFVGTSISAIGQIIPQIISLITAKEAEAMASGSAAAMEVGFPACLPALASIIATLVGVFASLPKFESGGIVGGSSFTGDKLLARVNSGEMILNKNQQRNLYQSLASAEVGSGANTLRGDVNFTISGSALKGTLKNYDSKMKKIK